MLPRALQMRSQMVLTAEDEQMLWWVLHRHAAEPAAAVDVAAPADGDVACGGFDGCGGCPEPSLNYDAFVRARLAKPVLNQPAGCIVAALRPLATSRQLFTPAPAHQRPFALLPCRAAGGG